MKKQVVLIGLIFLMWKLSLAQWTAQSNFPGAYPNDRRSTSYATVGSKAYVGLGVVITSQGFEIYKDFWEYNLASNQWTRMPDFPGEWRYDAMCFSIGTKVYVGGGDKLIKDQLNIGQYIKDFYAFDTQTRVWTRIADFPIIKGEAITFVINGKGYVACGAGGTMKELFCYDPSNNTWTQKADVPGSGRTYPIGFSINGKGYVGGGWSGFWLLTDPNVKPTVFNDFYEYDPSTDQWVSKGNTYNGGATTDGHLSEGASFSGGCKGYVITPRVNNAFTYSASGSTQVLEYEAGNNTWATKTQYPLILTNPAGCWINGGIYSGIGINQAVRRLSINGITAPIEICSTGNHTLTITPVGSVGWSTNIAGLSISGFQGNATSTRQNGYIGPATITALLTNAWGCQSALTKDVWVGEPIITDKKVDDIPIGSGYAVCPGNHYLTVVPSGGTAGEVLTSHIIIK